MGDEKQSIFSFQGADPAPVRHQPPAFRTSAPAQAEQPFVEQPLITSRRSAPEILHFVDTVFAERGGARGPDLARRSRSRISAHRAKAQGRRRILAGADAAPKPERDLLARRWMRSSQHSPVVQPGRRSRRPDRATGWTAARALPGHDAADRARRHHDPAAAARAVRQRNHPAAEAARASRWRAPTASASPSRSR